MKTVKEIREYAGISRAEFSRKYNIPLRSIENWEAGKRNCPVYLVELLERVVLEDYKKYLVEYAFAENFVSVDEWYTVDVFTSETAEGAAKEAACTDGLDSALFRVYALIPNEFGEMEKNGETEYFNF